jgi:hypothetical protein
MSKISYYSKRSPGISYPNYTHSNYLGYGHFYKKNFNYFKHRVKYSIQPSNNYFEERINNYSYYNNFPENYFYHSPFPKKNYNHKYNPYNTEEKKLEEESNNESASQDPKEEIIKMVINLGRSGNKELIIHKNDDIREKVLELCKENKINQRLIEPLYKKINRSLGILRNINDYICSKKNDKLFQNEIKKIVGKKSNNNS